jgi:hypothetical protein
VRFPGPTRHRDGFAVWSKRLEEGTYAIPSAEPHSRRIEMTPEELGALLSGIDLSTATRRKRYRRAGRAFFRFVQNIFIETAFGSG